MDKVYCSDCNGEDAMGLYCRKSYVVEDNYYSKKTKTGCPRYLSEKNRNNDCKDYKRKWWKLGG